MKPEESNTGMMAEATQGTQAPPGAQGKEMPPGLKKKVGAYNSGISQMLHNPKTRDSVYKMLKNGTPELDIPRAALTVNKQMESVITKKGKKPELSVLMQGGIFLVGELIDIGHAGGFFQLEEQDVGMILQDTMQQYIQNGLKDKSIDPIELQEAIEPLLSEEQRGIGAQVGQEAGISEKPGASIAMEQYANQKVAAAEKGFLDKTAAKANTDKGQQARQAQQQQPQQGVMQQQAPPQGGM